MRPARPARPTTVHDRGVAHERTSLAWERTAIAIVVNGILLARYAADDAHWTVAGVGIAETVAGAAVLVWAAVHYDKLHGPLRAGEPVVHPRSARVVGLLAIAAIGAALVLAVIITAVD